MKSDKFSKRLAALLALAVVALVVVSIDQFRNNGAEQQAAVLRGYGQ